MKNKGFSLAELLVVISIIGVLAAMAGIAYNRWMNSYNVESQMKQLYADLMSARVNAMSRNRMYFVTFPASPGITQYTIYEDNSPLPDGDGQLQTASDRQVTQKNLPSGYSMTASATQINLTAKGMIVDITSAIINGSIRVTNDYGADYDCINISGGSAINLGKWNGASCVAK